MAKKEAAPVEEPEGEEPEESFVLEDEVRPDPDEGLPEEVKKLSKKELYEKMKALETAKPPDPAAALSSGFDKLAASLKREAAPAPAAPAPDESENAFALRLKTDIFEEGKQLGVLQELVRRELGPVMQQNAETTFRQAERIMELDPQTGPVYKRYKDEIQKYIREKIPVQAQRSPMALEFALKQVQFDHLEEIAQERAQALFEAEKAKAGAAAAQKPEFSLEAGQGAGTTRPPAGKQIVITQVHRRIADERGVSPEEVARLGLS